MMLYKMRATRNLATFILIGIIDGIESPTHSSLVPWRTQCTTLMYGEIYPPFEFKDIRIGPSYITTE